MSSNETEPEENDSEPSTPTRTDQPRHHFYLPPIPPWLPRYPAQGPYNKRKPSKIAQLSLITTALAIAFIIIAAIFAIARTENAARVNLALFLIFFVPFLQLAGVILGIIALTHPRTRRGGKEEAWAIISLTLGLILLLIELVVMVIPLLMLIVKVEHHRYG